MKKMIALVALALAGSFLLCACGEEETVLLSSSDYELSSDEKSVQTSRGITIGDGAEAFLAAYGDDDILTSIGGGDYLTLPTKDIPFDVSLTTILPTFFVDGSALEIDGFCEANGIEKDGLLAFLTKEEYLSAHTVVYRYLVFTWEDGAITDIRSKSMDYNRDGSYYQPASKSADTPEEG